MLSHVYIGISDFGRALAFYTAVLDTLGLTLKFSQPEKSWAGWMQPGVARPLFLIGLPYNGEPAEPGTARWSPCSPHPRAVHRCHAVALQNGGRCEGPPGLRPQYHANYYGAYFRDPDGNKLCVCCHDPVPAA